MSAGATTGPPSKTVSRRAENRESHEGAAIAAQTWSYGASALSDAARAVRNAIAF